MNFRATNIYSLSGFGTTCSYASLLALLKKECQLVTNPKPKKPVSAEKAQNSVRVMVAGTLTQKEITKKYEIQANCTVEKCKKITRSYGDFSISGIADGIIKTNSATYILEIKKRDKQFREMDIRERIQILTYCDIYNISSIIYLQECNGELESRVFHKFDQDFSALWDDILQRLYKISLFIDKVKNDENYKNSIFNNGEFDRLEISKFIHWI